MRASILCFVVLAGGCVRTTTINIGTKTSLERQLVGDLEPLTDEELLAASVRAEGGAGFGSLDDARARAVAARRRQLFNRDDVDELKALGCLGETKDGTLAARDCAKLQDSEVKARQERLVGEENADRAAVIDWAVASDGALTSSDRPQVTAVYRRLLTERARPGDWLEADDGAWKQR